VRLFKLAAAASTECPHALGLVYPAGALNPDSKNLKPNCHNSRGFLFVYRQEKPSALTLCPLHVKDHGWSLEELMGY